MGAAKKLAERICGGKKLRKDQCLILILAGVLLCVVSLPVEKEKTKSDLLDGSETIIKSEHTFGEEEDADYVEYWEKRLGPSRSPTVINTGLQEYFTPCIKDTGPWPEVRQQPIFRSATSMEPSQTKPESGVTTFSSSAAEAVTILNTEPGS